MTAPTIHGRVEPAYEKVAVAFAENFERHGESGAACAVYVEGRPVVDIWAGEGTKGAWTSGTRSVAFSVSKGVTTICLLMAAERGLLELDALVASYWPEFAVNGKESTTVRQLLAHQAGLVAPERGFTHDELLAWTPVADQLAAQAPLWKPGTAFAYHALTFGWLTGEVLRRATGKRPSDWLRDHIARPLDLTLTFGCDPSVPSFSEQLEQLPIVDPVPNELIPAGHGGLVDRAMTMNRSLGSSAEELFHTANSAAFLSVEVSGGNLVSRPRDLARLYAATVSEVDGIRLLSPATLEDAAVPLSFGTSWIGTTDGHRWGSGFMLDSERRRMAGPGSFGHDGAGGQLAFANLPLGIGFGYQTVRPGGYPDERAELICDALRACI